MRFCFIHTFFTKWVLSSSCLLNSNHSSCILINIFSSDIFGLDACLVVVIMFHNLTLFEPSTRIFVSSFTRSSTSTTSQNPILMLTLVAKPLPQGVPVMLLYTNGVQTADTECTKTNNRRRSLCMTICGDIMADLHVIPDSWKESIIDKQ